MIIKKMLYFFKNYVIIFEYLAKEAENAPIAQLDRALDYGSKGWGFDSLWAYHYYREVAQLGSALRLGRRGRRFESCLPDHLNN